MPKNDRGQTLINKYVWIIETIYRAKKISFKELNERWLDDSEMSRGVDLSKRTFANWCYAIWDMFGIDIVNENRGEYRYYIDNVELHVEDFNNIPNYEIKADLIIFNLGFLPGSNRKVKTQDYTPEKAIRNCYDLLNDEGILIICSYRAHEGGMDEYNKIIEEIKDLNYTVKEKYSNKEALIVIKKESLK